MGRRKNHSRAWEEENLPDRSGLEGEPIDGTETPTEDPLSAFYLPQKVKAFLEHYEACSETAPGCKVMGDKELRIFFKAYCSQSGDPLRLYLQASEANGFYMHVSLSGEPALFVRAKDFPKSPDYYNV